ncbi:MAG: hypothetical protein KGR18_04570 [Acidobacteria bacterium]|nr:hypothetical protein [Acidobacteriota bacterium]
MTDWNAVCARNSRSVQTTIGWIFWDPGAIRRYEELGLPGPIGYIAARSAPLAPAGAAAVTAAFGSISPGAIAVTFALVAERTTFEAVRRARDEAVLEGLHQYTPEILDPLVEIGPPLWEVVEALPAVGRTLFAAHLDLPRPTDPVLAGWHAVNCLREWRGDTHWALVAASGLSGIAASILHNAWLGYADGWLPTSRGSSPVEIDQGWEELERIGLAVDRQVTPEGVALRQRLEEETDRLCAPAWAALGEPLAHRFAERFEPPCEVLLARVDETAGPNYQPASRIR